jgi:hypothetical protein
LPTFLSPLFSRLEKQVFGMLILAYPVAVYAKKNVGNLIVIFCLLCYSGLVHALTYNYAQKFLFDSSVVFAITLIAFLGFKMFYESWNCKSEKKAWNMLGLGFLVFTLMWACLQILLATMGWQ